MKLTSTRWSNVKSDYREEKKPIEKHLFGLLSDDVVATSARSRLSR